MVTGKVRDVHYPHRLPILLTGSSSKLRGTLPIWKADDRDKEINNRLQLSSVHLAVYILCKRQKMPKPAIKRNAALLDPLEAVTYRLQDGVTLIQFSIFRDEDTGNIRNSCICYRLLHTTI